MTVRTRHLCTRPILAMTAASMLSACGVMVHKSYPPPSWEGPAPQVSAPVKAYFDRLGVPHIFASNDDDAATMIGFLHGRDRRFQLELVRLAAQGRLTELLGKSMLEVDRRLRLLSFNLDEALNNLDRVDRARLDAYCAGINLAWQKTPRPLELKLLGYEPALWTTRDVVAISRLQSWDLSLDAELEAVRDRVAAEVPPKTMSWLLEPPPHFGQPIVGADKVKDQRPALPDLPPPTQTAARINQLNSPEAPVVADSALADNRPVPATITEQDRIDLARSVGEWLETPIGGSNSWAVGASHASNHKPLLAGDPHLDLHWPPIFYEIHVHTPEVEYGGATFPGMPMVVIGRAKDVAWTLTTSYADAQDLFSLAIDPSDPMKYKLDGKLESFKEWPQTFRWGKKPEEQTSETFRVSEFGPLYNPGREARLKPGATYALSWTGFATDPLPIARTFDRLYRSRSTEEVMAAIQTLPMPSQNWTFATSDGHIGYILGGRLPERRASALPRDGSVRSSAWTGYMSDQDRPKMIDPPSDFVVASNQPIVDDAARFANYASGAYRALRIETALESRPTWTPDQLRGLQIDTVNLEAARTVPLMLAAVEQLGLGTVPPDKAARATEMVAALRSWKFEMDPKLNAPLIYESWRGHLHQRLFRPHLKDPAVLEAFLRARLSEAPMDTALFNPAGQGWWDKPGTPEIESRETAVIEALLEAEAELGAKFGVRTADWTWGRAHTLNLDHPFASKWYLKSIFGNPTIAAPGGRHTIFALNHLGVIGSYKVESGPAIRQVVQPGSEAGFVLAGGNAGQPHNPYAMNQFNDWVNGRQHTAGGDEALVEKNAVGVIELQPGK